MKFVVIVLTITLFFNFAFADEVVRLNKIKVSGFKKTKKYVIHNELNLKEGSDISLSDIESSILGLRNTNLFAKVTYKLVGEEGKDLLIKVEEKWTTIPIVKFSSGGGVGQLTLGAYDPNLFGRYLELGGQYERLDSASSGVIWFKNPRLFGKKQGIDFQVWSTKRLRTKYEQDTDEPVIKTGFLHDRLKLYLNYNKELSRKLNMHFFYEYNDDSFSLDLLDDDVLAKATPFGIPISTKVHFAGLGLDYGQLNYESFKVDGFLAQFRYRYGLSATSNVDDFSELDISLLYYKTYKWDLTFAQRFSSGLTTTDILQYWKYLGGLDRVRGFSDNRFAGKYYWLSNSEVRLPVYRHKWLILQAVAFADIVGVSEEFRIISNLEGASVGGGIRLFLPKVYRFVVRLDYAQPIEKDDDMNISIGVQQFF